MIATATAQAKLTVRLRITGVRADGYHTLDAEMVALELADELTIDPDGSGLTASGPYRAHMPLDDSNLITRALRLVGRSAAVTIDKRIPAGGGLGGGSADAAAILRWAGFSDLEAASHLGADVPFCLVGGRADVRGIGEVIVPLPFQARDFTLIIPPLQASTPEVYRAWDALGGKSASGANDLESAAFVVEPRLVQWRDRIAEAAGSVPTLAGSGSTWFLDGHHHDLAAELPEADVVLTRTSP